MPATAEAVLPLERLRFELRFPDRDTSQDEDLRGQIASAVAHVASDLNLPLPDRAAARAFRVAGQNSITFRDPFFKAVTAIKYQAETETPIPGFYPDTFPPASYSRDLSGPSAIITPAVAWPEAVGRLFLVEGTYGLREDDERLPNIRAAAILIARDNYDGVRSVPTMAAYERLARPLRYYAPWTFDAA